MENIFCDSIDGQNSKDGSLLATRDPLVGVLGFLMSVDCFSVGHETEYNVVYLTSAVKSVENTKESHVMQPMIFGAKRKG